MPEEICAATPDVRPMSIVDLFTIGIGPSSSHTVGPMRAAARFAASVVDRTDLVSVSCQLFGSLALTGRGHATDSAVLLGLSGEEPETVDPSGVDLLLDAIANSRTILLAGRRELPFDRDRDLVFRPKTFLPAHANGMRFYATMSGGEVLEETYYSVGGGAIEREGDAGATAANVLESLPFSSGAALLKLCRDRGMSIADVVRTNETAWRAVPESDGFMLEVRSAMIACIDAGTSAEGILPGGLDVRRRAAALHRSLLGRGPRSDPSSVFDWVSLWALAVNEQNAAGGRVVTAPTNGAAGVIPAVLRYYETFVHGATRAGTLEMLYTASAIGFLYKRRASISAAEMGCQGEVGVACSMAAGGLVAELGGTPEQIENAAEIGMEHNLGLTCDPIGGLVQIPCIERNTMGAIKAINAAYLALNGDGSHVVSLDAVIETMRQTGRDMGRKYKETSLGGLAVNVVEC